MASGDPLQDAVIIWTRVTPVNGGSVTVKWMISESPDFQSNVNEGVSTTNEDRDYTVKVDVKGLKDGTRYFYKFNALGKDSPIGSTKTAPKQAADVKLAVVSCSNFEAGYYNAFLRIADRKELDAVLHLGDYIYEYEPRHYGDASTGRFHLPPHEITKLADYRTRYAQYRLDKDFQKVHASHPFIMIWDDHEIANNSFIKGAQNHQMKEGSYKKRKAAARKAYYEWMPVRENTNGKLYRKFSYGNTLDLIMLDERIEGRTAPAKSFTAGDYASETREMLGKEQLEWMTANLNNSTARWKVLGNQVIFSERKGGNLKRPVNLDAWDGYPIEKKKVLEFLEIEKIENLIIVTGDTHSSWAFEVCKSGRHYTANNQASYAVEFGTPSITSGNMGDGNPLEKVLAAEKTYTDLNPHLKYANLSSKGYLLLSLSANEAIGEWYYVDKVNQPSDVEIAGPAFRVLSGSNKLQKIRDFERASF